METTIMFHRLIFLLPIILLYLAAVKEGTNMLQPITLIYRLKTIYTITFLNLLSEVKAEYHVPTMLVTIHIPHH